MSTVREELDRLLNWYDANKPAMKGNFVSVHLTASGVEKFATKDQAGVLWYRDYKIRPMKLPANRGAGQPGREHERS
jgi:hypothetical protein